MKHKTKQIEFLLVVWLAMSFALLSASQGCLADESMGHHGSGGESGTLTESPTITAGESQTAVIGIDYARFGLVIVKMLGIMVAVWGFLEFGTSVYHHDPSVRMQGVLYVITGLALTLLGTLLKEWGIFR